MFKKTKDFLVVFTENAGARIEKDPAFISVHKYDSNTLLNPKIPKGSSPSSWSLKKGKIIVSKVKHGPDHEDFVSERLRSQQDQHFVLKKRVRKYKIISSILALTITIGCICLAHL